MEGRGQGQDGSSYEYEMIRSHLLQLSDMFSLPSFVSARMLHGRADPLMIIISMTGYGR